MIGLGGQEILILGCLGGLVAVVLVVVLSRKREKPRDPYDDADF